MKRRAWAVVLFAVSAALVLVGLTQGEFGSVFEKAVTVCLSCIGIG
ncbi:MAG: CD1871A family CXXC motif-containing protein [Candidatus Aminicenantes bacterium]|nr:CD1871A family CXXC motif-containing protein [Candidatus Aminicenantes bacterium]